MSFGLKIQDRNSGSALLDVDEGADPPSPICHTLFVDGVAAAWAKLKTTPR